MTGVRTLECRANVLLALLAHPQGLEGGLRLAALELAL